MPGIRTILDLLQSLGGLATGAVISLIAAITLLVSEVVHLDHTILALGWIMASFVFAIGFISARQAMKKEHADMATDPLY